jgi:hypothetical protein
MYLPINIGEKRAEKRRGGLEGPKEKKKKKKNMGGLQKKKTEGELF